MLKSMTWGESRLYKSCRRCAKRKPNVRDTKAFGILSRWRICTRIMGELKKLGIQPPSRNTVKNILKENGLEPGPKRGAGTWDEFLKIHAATLWQCDFFNRKVLTANGFRDLFLMVFLHVETRRVFISPATLHPNEAWVKEQAKAFLNHVEDTRGL